MIDKDKATGAVNELEAMKAVSIGVYTELKDEIDKGRSAEDYIIDRLGLYAGGRFIAEEYVERIEVAKDNRRLNNISFAELLIDELRCRWHEGLRIYTTMDWWREEAAEPWHPSLRGIHDKSGNADFPLSPRVSRWFNDHSAYFQIALRVLGTCYKP